MKPLLHCFVVENRLSVEGVCFGNSFVLNYLKHIEVVKIYYYLCVINEKIMEQTIVIKPNTKTIAVLKKMVLAKEEYRKVVLAKIEKKEK